MRIIVAATVFVVTIGGLFLFENYKTAPKEENYAQIVQNLQNQSPTETLTPESTSKPNKTPTKTLAPAVTLPPASSTPLQTSPPISTVTPVAEFTPAPTPTPVPQPTQQSDQIIIISLTSPIKQNSAAQLDIKTVPESQCTIEVILPSGNESGANGLEPKTAYNTGNITWSWRINWNTKPGTATINLSCSKDSQNFSKTLQIEIIE